MNTELLCIAHGEKLDKLLEISIHNSDKIEKIQEKLDESILVSRKIPKVISWTLVVFSAVTSVIVAVKKLL